MTPTISCRDGGDCGVQFAVKLCDGFNQAKIRRRTPPSPPVLILSRTSCHSTGTPLEIADATRRAQDRLVRRSTDISLARRTRARLTATCAAADGWLSKCLGDVGMECPISIRAMIARGRPVSGAAARPRSVRALRCQSLLRSGRDERRAVGLEHIRRPALAHAMIADTIEPPDEGTSLECAVVARLEGTEAAPRARGCPAPGRGCRGLRGPQGWQPAMRHF